MGWLAGLLLGLLYRTLTCLLLCFMLARACVCVCRACLLLGPCFGRKHIVGMSLRFNKQVFLPGSFS